MKDLWGEEVSLPHQPKQTPTRKTTVTCTSQDCFLYGHSWTAIGMSGEKVCQGCGVKGYCPVCLVIPPSKDAQPFLCTRHSTGGNA